MSIEDDVDAPIGTLEEQAADWIVRQDGTALDEAEQSAFSEWLAVSEHRREFDRQNAIWQRYRRMASLPIREEDTARAYPANRRTSRWLPAPSAIARRSAVPAIAAVLALTIIGSTEDWPARLRADYSSGIGERRSIALADGSVATLAASSALRFDQSDGARVATLLSGAAQFRVAPDPHHPFRVETDEGSVTALGTVFTVEERSGEPEVIVLEHSVAVRTSSGAKAVVREGESTTFTAQSVARPVPSDALAATAWTRGKLIVSNRPLSEVVAQLGQQRRGYWTVRGEAANLRVNGVYDLDHPLDALAALEKTLSLKSIRISNMFIVVSR
ncbi:FecR family protein [Novosphingobium sp. YAF33]|uniref:FecR family protein n=1 Tax=Novosphingobium sp. YAF33 TaxID=3233082 RepID=UPI003F94AC48